MLQEDKANIRRMVERLIDQKISDAMKEVVADTEKKVAAAIDVIDKKVSSALKSSVKKEKTTKTDK